MVGHPPQPVGVSGEKWGGEERWLEKEGREERDIQGRGRRRRYIECIQYWTDYPWIAERCTISDLGQRSTPLPKPLVCHQQTLDCLRVRSWNCSFPSGLCSLWPPVSLSTVNHPARRGVLKRNNNHSISILSLSNHCARCSPNIHTDRINRRGWMSSPPLDGKH